MPYGFLPVVFLLLSSSGLSLNCGWGKGTIESQFHTEVKIHLIYTFLVMPQMSFNFLHVLGKKASWLSHLHLFPEENINTMKENPKH